MTVHGFDEKGTRRVTDATKSVERAGARSDRRHIRRFIAENFPESAEVLVSVHDAMGICVSNIGKGTVPDLSSTNMEEWSWSPGQSGPSANRRLDWGSSGDAPVRHTAKTGAVLVDWKRGWNPGSLQSELAQYFEAGYEEEFDTLTPIVEAFTETTDYIGGGLGSTQGPQAEGTEVPEGYTGGSGYGI